MKQPIFNYSNLSKYLWIERKEIKFFTVCMPVCVVTLKSGDRIKIKADDLVQQLNSDRQERAKKQIKNYTFSERPYWYLVRNKLSDSLYRLDPDINTIECTCEDYENMRRMLGQNKVLCKHGHSLLQYLGFEDLQQEEYQTLVEDCYLIAEGQRVSEMNEMMSWAWQDDSQYWG